MRVNWIKQETSTPLVQWSRIAVKSEFQWPRQNPVKEIQDDDPEVKREMKVHIISIEEEILKRLESLISDWMRMKRVVA